MDMYKHYPQVVGDKCPNCKKAKLEEFKGCLRCSKCNEMLDTLRIRDMLSKQTTPQKKGLLNR